MRPIVSTVSLAAADADGIATSAIQNGAVTLNGALVSGGVATLDAARHISITGTTSVTSVTFTVTGTDRYGNTITEAITGPTGATTAKGTKNFKTVTAITTSGTTTAAVTIGSADEAEGPWIPLDHYMRPFTVGLQGVLSASASLTWGVEITLSHVNAAGFQEDDADAIAHATVTAKTADFAGSQDTPVMALRLAVSGHTTGSADLNVLQGGQ